ncbi:MAG: hypothetical protein KAI20_00875, partial [Thermoplasmatales archaeon]|nr:hypothetical protein [Thermoplasmatales archaeon]
DKMQLESESNILRNTIDTQNQELRIMQLNIDELQIKADKFDTYEMEIDDIKQQQSKYRILSDNFGQCCIDSAERIKDGSGRRYCDVCSRSITPEVIVVMERQGVIA